MADKKKQSKKESQFYDAEHDRKAIENWKSLADRVKGEPVRPSPEESKKDLADVGSRTRDDDRKAIAGIFGKDIGPSKEEKAAAAFNKKEEPLLSAKLAQASQESGEFRPTPTGRPTSTTDALERASLADRVKSKNPASVPDGLEAPRDDKPVADPWTQLGTDLESAKGEYKKERDNLSLREAIEGVANGLGKVGAGVYGQKTGTDMSGVKFDSKDWDKKRDIAQRDYQTSLSDVSDRRKEQIGKENNATESDYRNRVLKETTRHNKAMESIGGAKVAAASKAAMSKLSTKELDAFKKKADEVSDDIYTIAKDTERDGVDEDAASQRILSILQNKLGLSPEAAEEIVVDKGFFSDSMHDLGQIQSKVNAITAQQLGLSKLKSGLAEGEVAMQGPDGETYRVQEAQADAYSKQGYKRL